MLIYNVTINIDASIEEEWVKWMRETHIPDVMETGYFRDCKICRINEEEEGGKTYAVMYTAFSRSSFDKYQTENAPKLQAEHTEKFKDKFVAFRTLLSVIQEF